jgi:hypothetical protein
MAAMSDAFKETGFQNFDCSLAQAWAGRCIPSDTRWEKHRMSPLRSWTPGVRPNQDESFFSRMNLCRLAELTNLCGKQSFLRLARCAIMPGGVGQLK